MVENPGKFLDRIWKELNRAALSVGDFKGYILENAKTVAKSIKMGKEELLNGFMDASHAVHNINELPIGYVMLATNCDGYDGHAYGVSYSLRSKPIIFSPDEGDPRTLRPQEFDIAKVTKVWAIRRRLKKSKANSKLKEVVGV